jgi:hypothetical protein
MVHRDLGSMIPYKIRKRIRYHSDFFPDAGTTSRAPALHSLTTNRGNILCLYHHIRNKAGKVSDEGLEKKAAKGKQKGNSSNDANTEDEDEDGDGDGDEDEDASDKEEETGC